MAAEDNTIEGSTYFDPMLEFDAPTGGDDFFAAVPQDTETADKYFGD